MTRDTKSGIDLDPPLPRSAKTLPSVFVQTLTLQNGGTTVGELSWSHLPAHLGVYQLQHVEVRKKHRRQGYGSELLDSAMGQMQRHAKLVGIPVRRLIVLINQPDTILRAWLGQQAGFVHVHTLENVEEATDVMVFQRTFD
ncbi:MAG: GNAT family N-acetyltransferase [Planctomycetota bacterium]